MPLVSVIIPVYNRATIVPRAITSVLTQSFQDLELIIIDDCSDDGLPDLPVISSDQRIQFFSLPFRCGVSKARNEGVQRSNGKWIAFLDSDDEWLEKKVEKQLAYSLSHPCVEIHQTREIWIRNGKRVNPPASHEKQAGDIFLASLERCMITPSSVFITRELFDRTGGFNESMPACEDYDLWLRICCDTQAGLIDDYLLIRYGGHADQLSSSIMGLDRFRIRSIIGLLERNSLSESQKTSAIKTLIEKATVVANGYLKRGNLELYERYISIAQQYRR